MTPRLRIAQLNAGSLFEPDWSRRREEIVAWLNRVDADVVCFQEVWQAPGRPNTAGWIADRFEAGHWHWEFGGHAFAPELWPEPDLLFGSAVLSRWPIELVGVHRLGWATDPDPTVTGVPFELLHCRTAELDVFSTHLAPAPTHGRHRQVQVREIDDAIRSARGGRDELRSFQEPRPQMPSILCGDFNAEPDSDEIRFLKGLTALGGTTTFHQDAWAVAGDGSAGFTQDWRDNHIAAGMNVHRKRIDYVFVGDPFMRSAGAGRVLAAELAFHEPLTGVMASDHRGLVVDVAWPQRPRDRSSRDSTAAGCRAMLVADRHEDDLMELHPLCQPLAGLLGTWRGRGEGHYPTIDDFAYFEEVTFGHVGKPFLAYTQKTRHAETDEPLHAESGYFRPTGDGLELVLSQPSGIVEIHTGSIVGNVITLDTISVLSAPTAKDVSQVQRRIELGDDTMTYDLSMAAVGQPFQHHLRATLQRVDD